MKKLLIIPLLALAACGGEKEADDSEPTFTQHARENVNEAQSICFDMSRNMLSLEPNVDTWLDHDQKHKYFTGVGTDDKTKGVTCNYLPKPGIWTVTTYVERK